MNESGLVRTDNAGERENERASERTSERVFVKLDGY